MDDTNTYLDKERGTALPKNKNEADQCFLPNTTYSDEIMAYDTIEDLIEGLAVPTTEPSDAYQPIGSETSSGQELEPATEAGKERVNPTKKPRRPCKEDERQRRAERQRRYRERQRQDEAEAKNQITEITTKLETARLEQDSLVLQHTVMSKVVEYCTDSVHAAQALMTSSFNAAQVHLRSAVEGLAWLGIQVYTPSDSQLHSYLDSKNDEELDDLSENMQTRTCDLFNRYNRDPDARESIEAQLKRIRSIRIRCLQHVAKTRPSVAVDIVRRRMMPPGHDGAPNPKMIEAVAVLDLSQEQMKSFEEQWIVYLQKTASTRQETRSLINFLTSTAAEDDIESFCSAFAAGLFLERLEAVQDLERHPSHEAQAIVPLLYWFINMLTMRQQTTLVTRSMPYYPDVIQIGRILFGEEYANAIQSERLYTVQSE